MKANCDIKYKVRARVFVNAFDVQNFFAKFSPLNGES